MCVCRTNGHNSASNHSEVVVNAASLNAPLSGHGLVADQRSDHSSLRQHYDKLANERARALADASLLKA